MSEQNCKRTTIDIPKTSRDNNFDILTLTGCKLNLNYMNLTLLIHPLVTLNVTPALSRLTKWHGGNVSVIPRKS